MSKPVKLIIWLVWIVLLAFGIWGVIMRFTHGHEMANYGSYVPWGLWVSSYIYFIGLSAGAFLLSCLIYVLGIKKLKPIGRLALFAAAITLPMALVCIFFDLGHMWRSYEVFTRPNFTSMMAWMIWLYTAYFLLILTELWFDMRYDLARLAERGGPKGLFYRVLSLGWKCPSTETELEAFHNKNNRSLRILGLIGVPLALTFHGGVGALFATLASKPLWHSGLFPILFLTGALVSGGALILATLGLIGNIPEEKRKEMTLMLGRIVLGLLLFDLLLEWAEFSIPMWYGVGPEFDALHAMLFGEFWWVFWIIHILLGSAIPVLLLVFKPTSRWATFAAGSLIAVTFMAVRLNIVVPGQVLSPAMENLGQAYIDPRLMFSYMPSVFEWSIVAFVVALGIGGFYLFKKYLPLIETEAKPI